MARSDAIPWDFVTLVVFFLVLAFFFVMLSAQGTPAHRPVMSPVYAPMPVSLPVVGAPAVAPLAAPPLAATPVSSPLTLSSTMAPFIPVETSAIPIDAPVPVYETTTSEVQVPEAMTPSSGLGASLEEVHTSLTPLAQGPMSMPVQAPAAAAAESPMDSEAIHEGVFRSSAAPIDFVPTEVKPSKTVTTPARSGDVAPFDHTSSTFAEF